MNWLADIFSGGAAKLVDSVGAAVDRLVTSDQERIELKNALEAEMNRFKEAHLKSISDYDKEITTRHANDMKSDSWLSKSVRPIVLLFMTATIMGLAYSTIFILPPEAVEMVEPWLDLFKVLMVTIYAFYFGSRGFEKVNSLKKG